MSQLSVLKFINVALIIINAIVFLIPKKPMSGVHSNAAGILAIAVLVLILVWIAHGVLLGIAIYYRKLTLLWVITVIMVPLSILFWYLIKQ